MKEINKVMVLCMIIFLLSGISFVYSQTDPPQETPVPTPSSTNTQGDANNDGKVDIVDALLIAQSYVGLDPANFWESNADVNCDNVIDIIDALLVAQYYVGLLSELAECSQDVWTLTVEVENKDPNLPNCDGLPIISPPGDLITGATQYTYAHGTMVNAYILGSTPPPPGIPWQSAIFEYEGETGGFTFEMDSDKTITVIFYTILNPTMAP